MTFNPALDALRGYQAVDNIIGRKEDREYQREQRSRQGKLERRADKEFDRAQSVRALSEFEAGLRFRTTDEDGNINPDLASTPENIAWYDEQIKTNPWLRKEFNGFINDPEANKSGNTRNIVGVEPAPGGGRAVNIIEQRDKDGNLISRNAETEDARTDDAAPVVARDGRQLYEAFQTVFSARIPGHAENIQAQRRGLSARNAQADAFGAVFDSVAGSGRSSPGLTAAAAPAQGAPAPTTTPIPAEAIVAQQQAEKAAAEEAAAEEEAVAGPPITANSLGLGLHSVAQRAGNVIDERIQGLAASPDYSDPPDPISSALTGVANFGRGVIGKGPREQPVRPPPTEVRSLPPTKVRGLDDIRADADALWQGVKGIKAGAQRRYLRNQGLDEGDRLVHDALPNAGEPFLDDPDTARFVGGLPEAGQPFPAESPTQAQTRDLDTALTRQAERRQVHDQQLQGPRPPVVQGPPVSSVQGPPAPAPINVESSPEEVEQEAAAIEQAAAESTAAATGTQPKVTTPVAAQAIAHAERATGRRVGRKDRKVLMDLVRKTGDVAGAMNMLKLMHPADKFEYKTLKTGEDSEKLLVFRNGRVVAEYNGGAGAGAGRFDVGGTSLTNKDMKRLNSMTTGMANAGEDYSKDLLTRNAMGTLPAWRSFNPSGELFGPQMADDLLRAMRTTTRISDEAGTISDPEFDTPIPGFVANKFGVGTSDTFSGNGEIDDYYDNIWGPTEEAARLQLGESASKLQVEQHAGQIAAAVLRYTGAKNVDPRQGYSAGLQQVLAAWRAKQKSGGK